MNKFNLKDRVTISNKNVSGKIAYIGKTHFSEGEWFGIALDEAKGKNNGCVDGHRYFNCPRNHGIFVRSRQLEKEALRGENVKLSGLSTICNDYNSFYKANTNANRFKDAKKAMNEVKNITTTKQFLSINMTVKDFGNTSKELSDIKIRKKEVGDNVKRMEEEMLKMTEELNKRSKIESDLSENLAIVQREVAVLKRKLRNTERNLELSEIGRRKLLGAIEQLREITESAVIEKEIAEEKSEHYETLVKDEAHKNKTLEIEIEIMKEQMQLQCINGIPTKHFVDMLENRNKVLHCALQKLKDLYQGLQQQLREYEITAENNSNVIKNLKEAEISKENVILECEEEVAELYNTINDMTDADDVVFEVTDQNLKLETTIDNLYQQLHNVEDELEISEEIQDTLIEIKSICREEIDCLEAKVRRTQTALEQQMMLHKSNEEIIHKYQELTAILRERNRRLSDEVGQILRERKEAVTEAENLKLKIYREKRRNLTDIIQVENTKYDLENFQEELNCWSPFMPESFFVDGGEHSTIQVKLYTSKMIKKLDLIIKLLKASYPKSDISLKNEDLKSITIKTRFLIFATQLQSFLKIFNKSFDFIDTKQFLMLGKYHGILARKEEEIENYLTLLSKDEIDTDNCLESIRETFYSLKHLLEIESVPKFMEIMINSECCLRLILISCRCIMFYCLSFEGLDGITSDYKNSIQQIKKVVKKFEIYSRSIIICAKNSLKEKLYFCPIVETRAKHSWQLINDVMNSLISVNQSWLVEDEKFRVNNLDKVSLDEIICNLTQIEIDLGCLQKTLNNGELLVELVAETQIVPLVCRWAQKKKQEDEERIRNFKKNIASCEREIFDLSQTLHSKKKQDSHRESKALRDVGNQTKEFNLNLEAGDNSSVTDYLRMKLQDMEHSMRYLIQKNFELRVRPMKNHQSILTPLKVLPRPKYPPEIHDICVLQKRLNKLSVNLRGIVVPLVVDITKKSRCKRRNYKKYLAERIQVFQKIDEELWLISIEMRKMRKTSKCIWSNAKPFSLRNVD